MKLRYGIRALVAQSVKAAAWDLLKVRVSWGRIPRQTTVVKRRTLCHQLQTSQVMFHDQLMDLCRSKWTLQTITYSEQSHYNASFHTHYITRLLYLYGNTRRDLAAGSISAVVVPHKDISMGSWSRECPVGSGTKHHKEQSHRIPACRKRRLKGAGRGDQEPPPL